MLAGRRNSGIEIWSTKNLNLMRVIKTEQCVLSLAYGDGMVLAGMSLGKLHLYDVLNKPEDEEGQGLEGHTQSVWGVAFSPAANKVEAAFSSKGEKKTERYLLSGGGDGVLKVWSNVTYSCIRTLRFEGKISSMLCHGHRLIMPLLRGEGIDLVLNQSCHREVLILDLQTWRTTHRIQLVPQAQGNAVVSPMVVSSGHLIVASNSDADGSPHPAVALDLVTGALSAVVRVGAPCRSMALGGAKLFAGLREAPWLKAMPVE